VACFTGDLRQPASPDPFMNTHMHLNAPRNARDKGDILRPVDPWLQCSPQLRLSPHPLPFLSCAGGLSCRASNFPPTPAYAGIHSSSPGAPSSEPPHTCELRIVSCRQGLRTARDHLSGGTSRQTETPTDQKRAKGEEGMGGTRLGHSHGHDRHQQSSRYHERDTGPAAVHAGASYRPITPRASGYGGVSLRCFVLPPTPPQR
jgi:hypothetical protein